VPVAVLACLVGGCGSSIGNGGTVKPNTTGRPLGTEPARWTVAQRQKVLASCELNESKLAQPVNPVQRRQFFKGVAEFCKCEAMQEEAEGVPPQRTLEDHAVSRRCLLVMAQI